jgi:hypothetical protein
VQIESFCQAYSAVRSKQCISQLSDKGVIDSPKNFSFPRMVFTTDKSDISVDFCYQNFDQDFRKIFIYDQLHSQIFLKKAFCNFVEPKISFPPTFKYDKGSISFDSSKKQRCPAWTDRILYSARRNSALEKGASNPATKPPIEVLDYYSVDVRISDHRPVCGIYSLKLK